MIDRHYFDDFLDAKTKKYLKVPIFVEQAFVASDIKSIHHNDYSIIDPQTFCALPFSDEYYSFAPSIFAKQENSSILLFHKGHTVDDPIIITHKNTVETIIIIARANSRATIIIDQKTAGLLLSKIEIIADQNASIAIVIISDSAHWSKQIVNVHLRQSGAVVDVKAIVALNYKMQASLQTNQWHHANNTTSTVTVKTVVSDNACFLYQGCISIEKNAHCSSASQQNKNILWSTGAQAWSIPSLEVKTNDVKCAHGAATGPLDEEHIWYLKTRGMQLDMIHTLLINAFFKDLCDKKSTQAFYQHTILDRIVKKIIKE